MSRHRNQTKGFTLVELLVVIAIISTLMGLLLPAVQSAREAGRRNTCANNLSQLGKAVISYDGKKGLLPGWRNPNISNSMTATVSGTTGPLYGWPVTLLPSLERNDIYTNGSSRADGTIQAEAISSISSFLCPSAPQDAPSSPGLAYVGNAGYFGRNGSPGDGVLFDRSRLLGSARSMSLDLIGGGDGTSNTLLFAERSGATATTATWSKNEFDSDPSISLGETAVFVLVGAADVGRAINGTSSLSIPSPNSPGTRDLLTSEMLSSNHPGGVSVVFCDGHNLFLRDTIAPRVLSQLMTAKTANATAPYGNQSGTMPILREDDYK